MEILKVREFVDEVVVPGCIANITESGELQPISFILSEDGSVAVAAAPSFANNTEKFFYARAIERLVRGDDKIVALVVVFDSCTVDVPKGGWAEWRKKYDGPCDDPSHVDTVIFHCLTKDGEWNLLSMKYYPPKDGQPYRFDEIANMTGEDYSEHWFSETMPNPWNYLPVDKRPSGMATTPTIPQKRGVEG